MEENDRIIDVILFYSGLFIYLFYQIPWRVLASLSGIKSENGQISSREFTFIMMSATCQVIHMAKDLSRYFLNSVSFWLCDMCRNFLSHPVTKTYYDQLTTLFLITVMFWRVNTDCYQGKLFCAPILWCKTNFILVLTIKTSYIMSYISYSTMFSHRGRFLTVFAGPDIIFWISF